VAQAVHRILLVTLHGLDWNCPLAHDRVHAVQTRFRVDVHEVVS
jgi:hypothetical protein